MAPPAESVPPVAYGGTERIVFELASELDRRGHVVTVFASGDSTVPGELVPTVPRALRGSGFEGDGSGFVLATISEVLRRSAGFDIIHSHLDWPGVLLAHASRTPTVATFHGRLDRPFAATILADAPPGLVAISRSQASMHPTVRWAGIVHNGLSLAGAPFEAERDQGLVFVGRICEEKGVADAIEVARLTGRPIRIAAKIGPTPAEQAYAESVFKPALGRADTEFLGELSGPDRDRLVARSHALIMPGAWPEPFGLVAIEALACGTPVIGRRVGALPEVVRHGVDGFLADDPTQMAFLTDRVADLDRTRIRADVIERFSAQRMVDGYEDVYAAVLSSGVRPSGIRTLDEADAELTDRETAFEHGPIAAAESMAAIDRDEAAGAPARA
ncbi:MAG TPA: glycosyltransferase family 4 protein [Candidatus Saccharimonadia bacterium]|nr:glycosyltransferase family 4 protein [Candidatus Saccharimonadia bacterium]